MEVVSLEVNEEGKGRKDKNCVWLHTAIFNSGSRAACRPWSEAASGRQPRQRRVKLCDVAGG